MKEFNLDNCIAGNPVVTTGGAPMAFVAYDPDLTRPLLMKNDGVLYAYDKYGTSGRCGDMYAVSGDGFLIDNPKDLRMAPAIQIVDWFKLTGDTLTDPRIAVAIAMLEQVDKCNELYYHGMTDYTEYNEAKAELRSMVEALTGIVGYPSPITEEAYNLLANACDNLSDMPISEKWADEWSTKATHVLGQIYYDTLIP